MQLKSLGLLLDELQAVLKSKGCKVTEISVTFYPLEESELVGPADHQLRVEHEPEETFTASDI